MLKLGIKQKIKRVLLFIFGTFIDEFIWRSNYFSKQDVINKEINLHQDRIYLLHRLKEVRFSSALEVGSSWGANLWMIIKNLHVESLTGIDISKVTIKAGNDFFKKCGHQNISLLYGKATKLNFPERSFDLVFTWAVLFYIAPDKIEKAISEIMKVAKKRILLAEFHDPEIQEGQWSRHWIYNYNVLFHKYNDQIKNITISKIHDMDQDSTWKKYGYYIDVILL